MFSTNTSCSLKKLEKEFKRAFKKNKYALFQGNVGLLQVKSRHAVILRDPFHDIREDNFTNTCHAYIDTDYFEEEISNDERFAQYFKVSHVESWQSFEVNPFILKQYRKIMHMEDRWPLNCPSCGDDDLNIDEDNECRECGVHQPVDWLKKVDLIDMYKEVLQILDERNIGPEELKRLDSWKLRELQAKRQNNPATVGDLIKAPDE